MNKQLDTTFKEGETKKKAVTTKTTGPYSDAGRYGSQMYADQIAEARVRDN